LAAGEYYRYRRRDQSSAAPTNEIPEIQVQETDMNHSEKMHPFALRAALLSVLITSSMALLPTLAGAGTNHDSRDMQTLQAAAAQAENVRVAG
jgi:hypothetical protein